MHELETGRLWVGHIGDAHNLRMLLDADIGALVDLALNELPVDVTRELIYCRVPIYDGDGNSPATLRFAIKTTANLLRLEIPTFVFCSVGMSRSLAIAAAARAVVSGISPDACLARMGTGLPHDVSPGLWHDVLLVLREAIDLRRAQSQASGGRRAESRKDER